MEEKISFGKFIMKKRKEKNMTQKELAQKLFVTESAVSKWERGLSYPDISLITSICEALDITERELLTSSEDVTQRNMDRFAIKYQRMTKRYHGILLTCYLVRNTWINGVALMAVSCLSVRLVEFVFQYAVWGYTGVWWQLLRNVLPTVVITTLLFPISFWAVKQIHQHLQVQVH